MTQPCSLDVLARALVRARPDLPVHLRPLASLLAEQLKNYEWNPKVMGPLIRRTVERISLQDALNVSLDKLQRS